MDSSRLRLGIACASLLGLLACDGDSTRAITVGDDSGPGADASLSPPADASPSPGSDASPSPGSDAGPSPGSDAGPNPGSDAGPSLGSDAGPGPGTDAGPGPGTDAGPGLGSDAGPGTGSDAGPGTDAGPSPGSDAGPSLGSDAGGASSSCVTGSAGLPDLPPLAAGCTPRCSSATRTAVNMCTSAACTQMALMADTTPAIPWTLNGMMPGVMLNCFECVAYQQLSCALDACPTETMVFIGCNSMTDADMCNGEVTALNACVGGAGNATFTMCANREIVRCFPSGGGAAEIAAGLDVSGSAAPTLEHDLIPWLELDAAAIASFHDSISR